MSAWTPLRYVRQNLLIGPGGDAAALYRLPTIAYAFLPVAEKRRWLRRMERLAITIGANFSLYRVTRSHDPGHYVRDTLALLDPTRQGTEAFTDLLGHHETRLRALASHVPEVYLAVALVEDQTTGALGGDMVRALDRARRRLEDLAGVATPQPISRRELQALAAVEQRTFHLLQGVIDAQRATTNEIEWLLRRAACRGLDAPELERHWAPDALIVDPDDPDRVAYEPLTHDLVRLLNAPIVEPPSAPARLVVETENGDSHQALLAVGALADAAEFPGPLSELLYAPLEGVPFAVDAVLHAEWVGNRQALGQVRRRIVDAEQVFRDQTDGSIRGPGFTEEENRVLAREYEAILQSSAHPPMLRASISLAVAAPAADELQRRVDALREQYGQVQLHRPRGLQEALWLEHLPRADQGRVRDYTAQMTVEQFGALMPIGTQHVGSDPGIYLGISGGAGAVRSATTPPLRPGSPGLPRSSWPAPSAAARPSPHN